jgi:hypothetical protein
MGSGVTPGGSFSTGCVGCLTQEDNTIAIKIKILTYFNKEEYITLFISVLEKLMILRFVFCC